MYIWIFNAECLKSLSQIHFNFIGYIIFRGSLSQYNAYYQPLVIMDNSIFLNALNDSHSSCEVYMMNRYVPP